MYLLILLDALTAQRIEANLHSIMYLLIPAQTVVESRGYKLFTFHNVSINSHLQFLKFPLHAYLHSIMYLLIPVQSPTFAAAGLFTFHNVSINSRPPTTIISSIGFLLFLSTSFYSPHLISIFLL